MTPKVHQRSLLVKANMTPADVRNAKNATPEQKAMASIFDANNDGKYSQAEANTFNSTLISDHGNGKVSLWTRYTDGTRKETVVSGDVAAYKHAPSKSVRPYVRNVFFAKTKAESTNSTQLQNAINKYSKMKGDYSFDVAKDGTKTILFTEKDKASYKEVYYPNGKMKEKYVSEARNEGWENVEHEIYSANGTLQLKIKRTTDTETKEVYYPNGKMKEKYISEKLSNAKGWINTDHEIYSANGTLQQKIKRTTDTETKEVYYPNGKMKEKYVSEMRNGRWENVEHEKYDNNGILLMRKQ